MNSKKIILSGSASVNLARRIAAESKLPFAEIEISKFPSSDSRVRIKTNLKNKVVYVVQTTSTPTNDNLVELALIIDATKRLGAKKICTIIPWFGYSPQDKVFRDGEPLSSQVAVNLLESAGASEFVVFDIHSELVLDMFQTQVTNLSAIGVFSEFLLNLYPNMQKKKFVIASLDKGGAKRAKKIAKVLKLDLVTFKKSRDLDTGKVTFHSLSGSVKGKKVISFDDFTSTGSTLVQSAKYMKDKGAQSYTCCVTHAVTEIALKNTLESPVDELIVSNSIESIDNYYLNQLQVVDIAPEIARFIESE